MPSPASLIPLKVGALTRGELVFPVDAGLIVPLALWMSFFRNRFQSKSNFVSSSVLSVFLTSEKA
jgi:hypothetical protein